MRFLLFIFLIFASIWSGYSQSYIPGIKENIDQLRNDRSVQYIPIVINDQRTWSSFAADRVAIHSSTGGKTSEAGTTLKTASIFDVDSSINLTIDEKPFLFFVHDYYDSLRLQMVIGVDVTITDSFDFHIFRATNEEMQFGTSNSSNIKSVFKIPLLGYVAGMYKIDTVIPISVGKGNYITWGAWSTAASVTMKWNVNIFGVRNSVISHGLNLAASPDYNLNLESASEPTVPNPQRAANGTLDNGCFNTTDWNVDWVTNVCVSQSVNSSYNYTLERSTDFAKAGEYSLKAMLRATQPDSFPDAPGEASHRAELRLEVFPSPSDETWYGMSYYFPSGYVFSPGNNGSDETNTRYIITQWQHGTAGSPSIALEVFSDSIAMVRKYGTSNGGETSVPTVKFGKITKGQWIDIVVKVKWSKTNGEVQVWQDDENVYSDYYPTVYDDLLVGGSLKIGIYHFNWKEASYIALDAAQGAFTRELYFDEIKQYTGPNGLRIVSEN